MSNAVKYFIKFTENGGLLLGLLLVLVSRYQINRTMARSNSGVSGTIDLNGNLPPEKVVDLTGKVHHLPCCIKFNGPSDVSHYFKPKSTGVIVDGLSVEEAHFRGRKLQGTTVAIPHGYSGFVLGKKMLDEKRKRSEEDSSCWEVKARFQNITLWNHDSLPSENDASLRAFHLFSVATAEEYQISTSSLKSATKCLAYLGSLLVVFPVINAYER